MYIPETIAIFSIENPKSIKIPKIAVPKAEANTIKAVDRAFIDPIYFTPYISAHNEDPRTFAHPLEIPTKPKNINEVIGASK